MALRRELVFFKNSCARHRKAYLARVKTPKLAGGEPILVVGTVKALEYFTSSIRDYSVVIEVENTTAASYINKLWL